MQRALSKGCIRLLIRSATGDCFTMGRVRCGVRVGEGEKDAAQGKMRVCKGGAKGRGKGAQGRLRGSLN